MPAREPGSDVFGGRGFRIPAEDGLPSTPGHLNAGRPEYDQTTVWKSSRLPVVSYGVTDRTSGLHLVTSSGSLGRWSRYNEGQDDEDETLLTYLEDVADMLESPDLATRDKPGLIDGVLVWGSRLDPAQEDWWQPLTG